jgi:intracellular multiplication protein IcmE
MSDQRKEICRQLGLRNEMEVYQLVAAGAKSGPAVLLTRRLTAPMLTILGYDRAGMKKLGFSDKALQDLGYVAPKPTASERPPTNSGEAPVINEQGGEVEVIRQMMAQRLGPSEFRSRGYTIHHLKKAGFGVAEVERAGFQLDDMIQAFGASDLRRAGHGIRELRRHFQGHELRNAGFDATDMRNAGFTIPELLRFGYNENQVKGAGFSTNELIREGLTKQTVDKRKMY